MSVRANKDTFESEINEAGKLVIADFRFLRSVQANVTASCGN